MRFVHSVLYNRRHFSDRREGVYRSQFACQQRPSSTNTSHYFPAFADLMSYEHYLREGESDSDRSFKPPPRVFGKDENEDVIVLEIEGIINL